MTDELAAEERFAPVPEWVLYHPALSDRAVRLYGVLLRHADRDGKAFPSRAYLARRLDCSVDSVDRAMKQLRRADAVNIQHRSCDGGYTASVYTVAVSAPVRHPSRKDAATPSRKDAAYNESQLERTYAPPHSGGPDELFEAVCAVVGKDWQTLTRTERGKLNRAVGELRRVGATPAEVRARAARYPKDWVLTEMALVGHWSALSKPRGSCPPHNWVDVGENPRGLFCTICKRWEKPA